jgi:hypothetical protein
MSNFWRPVQPGSVERQKEAGYEPVRWPFYATWITSFHLPNWKADEHTVPLCLFPKPDLGLSLDFSRRLHG